jgi:hypothetical protein
VRLGALLALSGALLSMPAGTSLAGPRDAERLPDLEQRVPYDLDVSIVDGRYRLGFSSAVTNIGAGPLVVVGTRPNRRTPTMTARQLVRTDAGVERAGPVVGRLRYENAETHSHWHLLPFDAYQLLPADGSPALTRAVKQGFCLGDRYRDTRAPDLRAPINAIFRGECGKGSRRLLRVRQGISVGYGDVYRPHLEGQSFDVTDLPAGEYVLAHEVNAGRRIRESDYTNNAASMLLRLEWAATGEPLRVRILARCPGATSCPPPPSQR